MNLAFQVIVRENPIFVTLGLWSIGGVESVVVVPSSAQFTTVGGFRYTPCTGFTAAGRKN